MLKTSELLELTDEDLLSLVGRNIIIRLSARNVTDEDPEPSDDSEEALPFKTVVAVGTLIELQYSSDTGGSIAYMYSGSAQPDELRWDSDEYRAEFIWEFQNNGS